MNEMPTTSTPEEIDKPTTARPSMRGRTTTGPWGPWRRRLTIAGLVLMVACMAILGWPRRHMRADDRTPPIADIRELGELVVLSVRVEDVVVVEAEGWLGSAGLALRVAGDVDLAVDLSSARVSTVDDERRRFTLVLSLPRPRRARVDQSQSRVAGTWRSPIWLVVPDPAVDRWLAERAGREAQSRIERTGESASIRERAKESAEVLVERLAGKAGWTVELRWLEGADRPGPAERRGRGFALAIGVHLRSIAA